MPNAKANHALDITDIYAFDGASSSKTVLVLDVNPLAGVMSGTRFATDAEYRLNIDRTGDAVADDVYTVTFRDGGPGGKQLLTLKKNGSTVLTGKTGNANNGGGAKLFAGVRDDPFFFDLASFLRWRDPDGDGKYTYTGPTTFDGIDFFKGTNDIVHRPRDPGRMAGHIGELLGHDGQERLDRRPHGQAGAQHGVHEPVRWHGPEGPLQPDRAVGRRRDLGPPVPGRRAGLLPGLRECGLAHHGLPAAITGLLLPDALHLDVAHLGKSTGTSFTGDTAGHILNGRTLAEDVIDLELLVVTGGLAGHAVISTDGVPHNDAAFPGTFPYLATAH